ncbi:MAG: DUF4157 domain-containing protein, partial [Nitrospira sp.]|nr:DUF4157 domain-containing protein [Nitrospira sp.]
MPYRAPQMRHPSKPICTLLTLRKAPPKPGVTSSLFRLQRSLGNQTIQSLIQSKRLDPFHGISGLQSKLTLGPADDQYEKEANQVANRVMTMPNLSSPTKIQPEGLTEEQEEPRAQPNSLAASITSTGQRQSLGEEDQVQSLQASSLSDTHQTGIQRINEPEEEETLQRQAAQTSQSETRSDIERAIKQSQGRGSTLPDATRDYMEPRFGVDLSDVRVHQGKEATKLNQALSAQAFTVGKDIYLGAGKTAGNSPLLAHELTHVLQQTGKPPASTGEAPRAQRTCPACATKKPGEKSCPACTAPNAPPHSSTVSQSTAKGSVLRAPSSTSNDCWSLRAKCYYYCTKSHLWRIPPDTKGFF